MQQAVKLKQMADQHGLTGTSYGAGGSFDNRGRNNFQAKMMLLSSSER